MYRLSRSEGTFTEELYNKYYKRIYTYCQKRVKWQNELSDLAEDCTQNTFLEAHRQISRLRSHPNIEGWLYTTARNMINHSYRSMYAKKRREVILDETISNSLMELDQDLERLFHEHINYEALCSEILGRLNEKEYELYTDYYQNRMSVSSLSEKYGITVTATTTRIHRLKKKIKMIIHEHYSDHLD
ncbi:DNA-directed RNA polymerase sigma-70 factor [Paenibacillus aceti]|uniref:DNA-directed RNA polymerase sigma-70 factor n=1 Tax=Paenibacillus aceti TaxID=1820010 RepID=A0ABQ1VU73_9BACL|nr:sigma-70 family RNA polymerase sigma factor [Paenibacillus aceti]GGF98624.1 DNA-directed RNA polymerase sigma-70 factor [Paenibacillus aceti]